MKSDETNSLQQHPTLLVYDHFFEIRNLSAHLFFTEEWMESVMTCHDISLRYKPSAFLLFYDLLVKLYDSSFALYEDSIETKVGYEQIIFVEKPLEYEQSHFSSVSGYLSAAEIQQPLLVLKALQDQFPLSVYKNKLFEWLTYAFNPALTNCSDNLIFPLYRDNKRLILAAWLIRERILKIANKLIIGEKLIHFQDTCPLLLESEKLDNPYLLLDDFFSTQSLNKHIHELKNWFKTAATIELKTEKLSDVNFFYEQLTQLIEACYHITCKNMLSLQNAGYSNAESKNDETENTTAKTTDNFINSDIKIETFDLSEAEIENPLEFLTALLTLENIKYIRFGLKEWVYFCSTEQDGLWCTDRIYGFELYEKMEKIILLSFLVLSNNAPISVKDLTHE